MLIIDIVIIVMGYSAFSDVKIYDMAWRSAWFVVGVTVVMIAEISVFLLTLCKIVVGLTNSITIIIYIVVVSIIMYFIINFNFLLVIELSL
jgi:hypothetical protein